VGRAILDRGSRDDNDDDNDDDDDDDDDEDPADLDSGGTGFQYSVDNRRRAIAGEWRSRWSLIVISI